MLAVTQLIGWGNTFDMLGVMGRIIATALGLPNEAIFAGLTIMMVINAFAGPATGRWLGCYDAAKVLAASSITFAIGLLLRRPDDHHPRGACCHRPGFRTDADGLGARREAEHTAGLTGGTQSSPRPPEADFASEVRHFWP